MLNIQEVAKQSQQTQALVIDDRLPDYLEQACHVSVLYSAEAGDDFYLLHLHVIGKLQVTCQRCTDKFPLDYDNQTTIAICRTDERAEQLLEHYECFVSSNWKIDLNDIVCDELHLYVPEFHKEILDCNTEINQFLTE